MNSSFSVCNRSLGERLHTPRLKIGFGHPHVSLEAATLERAESATQERFARACLSFSDWYRAVERRRKKDADRRGPVGVGGRVVGLFGLF